MKKNLEQKLDNVLCRLYFVQLFFYGRTTFFLQEDYNYKLLYHVKNTFMNPDINFGQSSGLFFSVKLSLGNPFRNEHYCDNWVMNNDGVWYHVMKSCFRKYSVVVKLINEAW